MMDTGLISLGAFWGSGIANHLWQSTLFAAAAWLLTLFFRKNRARVRYWIWVSVSAKFLIPFSLLVSLGGSIDIGWILAPGLNPSVSAADWTVVQSINQPFSPQASIKSPTAGEDTGSDPSPLPAVTVVGLWVFGAIGCLSYWMKKNRRVSRVIRESEPLSHGHAFAILLRLMQTGKISRQIRLASSNTSMEPGVFGIFRPVLLLPAGMPECLHASEMEAILEHELSHIRCRDNLVAALHMFVEGLFWFHPLVWWIGSKLVHEREKACDEAVLQSGKEPEAYAKGILKVCEFYLESPLACVSGVIGSNLKKRIEGIMKQHIGQKLNTAKKLLLLGTCFLALGTPLLIGALTAQPGLAQSQDSPKPLFDAASIKPTDDCREIVSSAGRHMVFVKHPVFQPGRFTGCSSLKGFISIAYQIEESDISGGPDWIDSASFKIEAKAEDVTDTATLRLMLQSLLEERFGLEIHRETQEKSVYSLVVAKGGHKLKEARDENGDLIVSLPPPEERMKNMPKPDFRNGAPPKAPGVVMVRINGNTSQQEFTAYAVTMQKFAVQLKDLAGRRVVDRTGLKGYYDIELHTALNPQQLNRIRQMQPAPSGQTDPIPAVEPSGPSIFTAVQEQLGLKLESDEAPLDFLVIDSAEKPSEN